MKKNPIEQAAESKRQELEKIVDDKRISAVLTKEGMRGAEMIGALRAMDNLHKHLGSQVIRGLEQFQSEKGYESYGFTRFDDFLDGYENSPMSKRQYYDRRDALNREGDELYDALNALKIPMSARKLLGDGSIQIEGDEIVIGDERTSLSDRNFIKQTIQTLAQKQSQTAKELEKLRKKVEKGDEENNKLKQKIDTLKNSPLGDNSQHPHSIAHLNLIGAFNLLAQEAEELSDEEKQQLAPRTFETIAAQMEKLSSAYNRATTSANNKRKKKDLPEVLPSLDDDELAELMD